MAVEFFYSDKTPMRYAEVLVFSPENEKAEYQNGRTDQSGRFAFLAETPGEWQMKVNDGMGHATVTVNPARLESKTGGDNSGNRSNEFSLPIAVHGFFCRRSIRFSSSRPTLSSGFADAIFSAILLASARRFRLR